MASFVTDLEIWLSEQKEKYDNRPRLDLWWDSNILAPNPESDSSERPGGQFPGEFIGPKVPGQFPGEFIGPTLPGIPSALMEVINNPSIMITKEMLPIINDDQIVVTREGQPAKKLSGRDVIRSSGQFSQANLVGRTPIRRAKKKRKVSKYQKEFGQQLKKLKAKHPRSKIQSLMKRAHAATRKALK